MVQQQSLLPSLWEIPQVLRDRLGVKAGRQRAMMDEGHLLVILHAPPGEDHADRVGRFYWREPDGNWHAQVEGRQRHSLATHLEEFEKIVHELDERDPAVEDARELHADITALAPLVRAARNLHAALQHARDLCGEDHDLVAFRDRAYQIQRMAELAYQDAQNTLGFTTALQAEAQATSGHQMAVSAHRLNVLAAFFFPMATLGTVFGVNMDHGFEHRNSPLPFFIVVVCSLAFGFLLKSFVTSGIGKPQPGGGVGNTPAG